MYYYIVVLAARGQSGSVYLQRGCIIIHIGALKDSAHTE